MRCQEARELLVPYLDGEVSLSERVLVQAHLAECDRCREDLAVLSALQSRLGQFLQARAAQAVPSPQAWSRLEGTLAREARPSPPRLTIRVRRLAPDVGHITRLFQGGLTMKKGIALASLALLSLALGTVAFVPPLQAEAMRLLGRPAPVAAPAAVQRASETPFPGSTPVKITDATTGESHTIYQSPSQKSTIQTVTWEDAQAAVDFPLARPAYLPEGAKLERIQLVSMPDGSGGVQWRGVTLFYAVGDDELAVEQRPAVGPRLGTPPGATTVSVKGSPGWTVTHENTILTWRTDKVSYDLSGYLPLEEMLKIAESLEP